MIADGTPIFGLTGWAGTFAALDAAAIGCICPDGHRGGV
jgi:OPA family hexose phosphate transport protein UhpT-like MFS transporter